MYLMKNTTGCLKKSLISILYIFLLLLWFCLSTPSLFSLLTFIVVDLSVRDSLSSKVRHRNIGYWSYKCKVFYAKNG